jgi:TPR repeat protein
MVAAARWYKRAAEQGVAAAMVNFAILCEGGQGTERSAPIAYAWYRAAATRGDESAAKRADELYRQFSGDDKAAGNAAAAAAAESIHEKLLAPAAPAKPSAAGLAPAHSSG